MLHAGARPPAPAQPPSAQTHKPSQPTRTPSPTTSGACCRQHLMQLMSRQRHLTSAAFLPTRQQPLFSSPLSSPLTRLVLLSQQGVMLLVPGPVLRGMQQQPSTGTTSAASCRQLLMLSTRLLPSTLPQLLILRTRLTQHAVVVLPTATGRTAVPSQPQATPAAPSLPTTAGPCQSTGMPTGTATGPTTGTSRTTTGACKRQAYDDCMSRCWKCLNQAAAAVA